MLDKSYNDTWDTRRRVIGNDYQTFLKSDVWLSIKKRASKKPHIYGKCWICGSTKGIELHHKSYKYADLISLANIVPLCRKCHQRVHDYAKKNHISVRMATRKVRKIYKRYNNKQQISLLQSRDNG